MRIRGLSVGLAGAVWASLVLPGCGEAPPGEPDGGAVRDSAGVRLVELPPEGAAPAEWHLAVDPDWTPGSELEIGELADLDLTPDGRLVLLDPLWARVTVLAPSGEVEASFGSPGEGPGELQPQGLSRVVVTDSTVLVPDLLSQRITEFRLDGELVGSRPFPQTPTYAVDWRGHPEGGLAFRVLSPDGDPILRVAGGRVDTLFVFPAYHSPPNTLLGRVALWDLTTGGGLAVGLSDRLEVEFREGGAGGPRWIARRPDVGGPLTETDRTHLRGVVIASEERELGGSLSPEERARIVGMVGFPEYAPVLAAIHAAPDGALWLQETKPVEEMGREALRVGGAVGFGGPEWLVLAPDGRLRARALLPEGFTPRRFSGPWIYGVLEDELGVEAPARVRIPG